MSEDTPVVRPSFMDRLLKVVERGGNALPHPASLFAILSLAVIALSGVAAQFDLSVIHPSTGELVSTVNLLPVAGGRLAWQVRALRT